MLSIKKDVEKYVEAKAAAFAEMFGSRQSDMPENIADQIAASSQVELIEIHMSAIEEAADKAINYLFSTVRQRMSVKRDLVSIMENIAEVTELTDKEELHELEIELMTVAVNAPIDRMYGEMLAVLEEPLKLLFKEVLSVLEEHADEDKKQLVRRSAKAAVALANRYALAIQGCNGDIEAGVRAAVQGIIAIRYLLDGIPKEGKQTLWDVPPPATPLW